MNTIADSFRLALQLVGSFDAALWGIVSLSMQVSATACLIGALVGLLLGAWLAVARFPGHGALVWVINTLLALPSVVVGLLVYLLLSRAGPLGEMGILFTPSAMVVAQSVLVVPLVAALSRRLVADALTDGADQLRSLGAGPLKAAMLMLVHARLAVLTILLTAFGRAISEVGAVMIVGGNIDGVTRVMTTAIALETSKGDLPLALALGLVLLAVVGVVNLGLAAVQMPRADVGASVPSPQPSASATASATAEKAGVSGPPPRKQGPLGAPLLTLRGAAVRFGSVQALYPLKFELRRGERIALVGANGSGKTTLLRLLHGLVESEPGHRTMHAVAGTNRPARAAMLFQRPFLLALSVSNNLALALWLSGVPRSVHRALIGSALARVGLAATRHRPARSLSGGQQQRLALARAMMLEPELLLLDEPTASLDPSAKREIETLIEEIAAQGVTLVMSTHNLGQAKRLADRVVYLEGGKLIADRPVDLFFNGPLPAAAALFVKGELPW